MKTETKNKKWKALERELHRWHKDLEQDCANLCGFSEEERNVLHYTKTRVESLLGTYFGEGRNENEYEE